MSAAQQACRAGKDRRRMGWMAVPLLALLLSACSDNGVNDLRQFVENAKQKKGRVEPLPQFKPVESYAYQAAQLRDPFGAGGASLRVAGSDKGGSGVNPDISRRKEALESYPLDALQMMGTFEFKDAKWGLIKAPDGIVYRIRPGNHLGQNYGKVQAIQDKKITLVEIVPDGLGGWLERDAYLAINEQ
jgi:type IV pilus assembly protein PilP